MMRSLSLLFLASALGAAPGEQAAPFVPLFDGKTLNGWEVCNGLAKYTVEDGMIVGATAKGSPNSFLCTQKDYGDFVLEFDVNTDPALNTGVQIRSHRYPDERTVTIFDGKKNVERKQPKNRVHGYQVEIGNEAGANNGGIYDEARRGWVAQLPPGSPAARAFHDNQWNHYKVSAIGDSIQTWVNGVPCADLVDPLDQTGFIALQVHQFAGDKTAQVRFRNIRLQDQGRHAWKPIWDGRTLSGWTPAGGAAWKVEDGAIHARSLMDNPQIGFLVGDRDFTDVTVRVHFKMIKGNSGLFLRSEPQTHKGYEVEIDEAKRTGGFWEAGGRGWVIGPEDNAGVKPGDWNELTASLHGQRLVIHLNGVKTVDREDPPIRTTGRIALQCHGGKRESEIWFKDLEILE